MPGDVFTRRAALMGFGAFAAAGLSGCNTTPMAGAQPVAASGLGGGAIVDTAPLVAYVGNPTAGWVQQSLPGALARALGPRARWRASRACRHALSGQRRARRSGPDKRRRDIGRQDNKSAGELDLLAKPDRSGAARTGAAGPGAGAVGRLRLPAEEEARGLRRATTLRVRACASRRPWPQATSVLRARVWSRPLWPLLPCDGVADGRRGRAMTLPKARHHNIRRPS